MALTAGRAVIVLTLVACGSSQPETEEAQEAEQAHAPPSSMPSASSSRPVEAPVYRARVVVRSGQRSAPLHWTDVEVPGDTERARRICEALLEDEVSLLSLSDLTTRVARECELTRLPPVTGHGASHLLVDRRALTDVDIQVRTLGESVDASSGETATVIAVSPFSTEARCQAGREELLARRHAARAEAAGAADSWLRAQLSEKEQAAARACEERSETESRCAELADASDVEEACRDDSASDRCRATHEQALQGNTCEIELQRLRRECDNTRALVELLRQRLEGDLPEAEPMEAPACQPAE